VPLIPTEPLGSIPRSAERIEAIRAFDAGKIEREKMDATQEALRRCQETGSPVISDGEQSPVFYRKKCETVYLRQRATFRFLSSVRLMICGFSPFCDDLSTTRDTAFEKIRARVEGAAFASILLGI